MYIFNECNDLTLIKMNSLIPIPYSPLVDQQYNEVILDIKDTAFKTVTYQEGQITILFDGCFFNKLIIKNDNRIHFEEISIVFSYCYIGDIQVNGIASGNVSIDFSSCIVSGKIESKNLQSVSANNCFADGFFLIGLKKVYISYTRENIFPREWIGLMRRVKANGYLEILSIKTAFYINSCQTVNITGSEENTGKGSEGLYLNNLPHKSKKNWSLYGITKADENHLNFNLHVTYSDEDITTLKISNQNLRSLSIKGNVSGSLSVENCKVNNIYLVDFAPKGNTVFYRISPGISKVDAGGSIEKRKVEINKCDLDNVWFDNFYFDGFDIISFYRTKFSKAIFSSCNFPDDYGKFQSLANSHYPQNRTDNFHKDQYEIFLQLRRALEATGNFYESQKIHAVSNDALRAIKGISLGDKFVLGLNKLSNNHGLSFANAFCWFLCSTILLYILYLASIDRIFICNADFDSSLVGYYFAFIDITHRVDFLVKDGSYGFFTIPIDYLSKVVIGFLIYQFIAAFRKYAKR